MHCINALPVFIILSGQDIDRERSGQISPKTNLLPGLSVPSNTAHNAKYLQIIFYMSKSPFKTMKFFKVNIYTCTKNYYQR
jgi:hypothetical protein